MTSPSKPDRCPTCKRVLGRSPKKARSSIKEIRAKVAERAGNACECGCGRSLGLYGADLDHWLGGSGRRKQRQSVETCWMLTFWCHGQRTANDPSAAHWNERFRIHCLRYGYPFTPHIEKRSITKVA